MLQPRLYEKDFYAWTQEQANILRAEELEKLDIPNLIEEIESMGASQRKEIKSRLLILIMHLLKLHYQSRQHPNSWLRTIRTQRNEIEFTLSDSPSLRRELPAAIEYVYPRARKQAAAETGLPLATFPATCPYTVDQILDDDFFPGNN